MPAGPLPRALHLVGEVSQPPELVLLKVVVPLAKVVVPLADECPELDGEAGNIMGRGAADLFGECHRCHHRLVPPLPAGALDPRSAPGHDPLSQDPELRPECEQFVGIGIRRGDQWSQEAGENGAATEKHWT
jgi:hypothetical protein